MHKIYNIIHNVNPKSLLPIYIAPLSAGFFINLISSLVIVSYCRFGKIFPVDLSSTFETDGEVDEIGDIFGFDIDDVVDIFVVGVVEFFEVVLVFGIDADFGGSILLDETLF